MRTKNSTIILPSLFYRGETWSLILRKESRLWVSENRALRRIFGSKRDKVTAEWRRIRHEEIHDLYFSPHSIRVIKSRRMRWAGHVASMGRREMQRGFWWGNLMERETTWKTQA
jgi:hypothetical protein